MNGIILLGTLAMTFLTFAKELVLYHREKHGWLVIVDRLALHGYYPLLTLNLLVLLTMMVMDRRRGRFSILLAVAAVIFVVNVLLFSSNNILNLIEGQPLHRWHRGIGW